MAVVSAVPRVMVSAPVPPVMVSVLATVAELVPLPKVSVSLPPPRSMLALATAPVRTMVSAPAAGNERIDRAEGRRVGGVAESE